MLKPFIYWYLDMSLAMHSFGNFCSCALESVSIIIIIIILSMNSGWWVLV